MDVSEIKTKTLYAAAMLAPGQGDVWEILRQGLQPHVDRLAAEWGEPVSVKELQREIWGGNCALATYEIRSKGKGSEGYEFETGADEERKES